MLLVLRPNSKGSKRPLLIAAEVACFITLLIKTLPIHVGIKEYFSRFVLANHRESPYLPSLGNNTSYESPEIEISQSQVPSTVEQCILTPS